MNKLEEKKQNFDIDKNKQDIRRLEKSNRSQGEDIAALNQFKIQTNTSLTKVQTDLSEIKSDIAALQAATQTEEKIELQSYDCYKTNERIYRDTCWLPRPIAFCAESGKMFKFRVKFNAVSTFETTITSTATITLDGEEIHSDTKEIPAGGTHAVDFEHSTSSERGGHKLVIELRNTETAARRTNCCIPDMLTVELWGTNVQFVTRSYDFAVIPAGEKVVMTTLVYDQPQALFSMQTPDANFSFEESMFKWFKANDYRNYNYVLPAIAHYYDTETNTMFYCDKPTLVIHNFANDETKPRIANYVNVDGNNEDAIGPSGINVDGLIAKSLMANSGNNTDYGLFPDFITMSHIGMMFYQRKNYASCLMYQTDFTENIDCCGAMRVGNDNNKNHFYGVATRQDGTSFFWGYDRVDTRIELGFGTHSNAYLVEDDKIIVFLRVGKDTKKIILEPIGDQGQYGVANISIIPNVQEYWLAPNGAHFERVGNKIYFYLANSTTPEKTLKVFC